jgi:type VI secretion system protein
MRTPNPSLYEMLLQNFTGDLDLDQIGEGQQYVLSILDNVQRILNSCAGSVSHLPDYGLPDMSTVLDGLPASAYTLMSALRATLLAYEPRLAAVRVVQQPQPQPGYLDFALELQLRDGRWVTFGTTIGPEGKVLVRHLKRQSYLSDNPSGAVR